MKGKAAPRSVVTSGRLTGAAKGTRVKRTTGPDVAYSLYSTDSEDQVTTLHRGLDRCAALLNDMLHDDQAASPIPPRTVKGGAAKSRLSTSRAKKINNKPPSNTEQKGSRLAQTGRPKATARAHMLSAAAEHTGVKLPLPQRRRHVPPSPNAPRIPPTRPRTPPSLLSSENRPVCEAGRAQPDPEEDLVPVRDTETPPGVQVQAVQAVRPEAANDSQGKASAVQDLLETLKSLIAGRGNLAERLLGHLEHALSSPDLTPDLRPEDKVDVSSLQIQNTQLRRRVRLLNQQLQERERAEKHQSNFMQSHSEVQNMQDELLTAQSRLQELHGELAELRRALQVAQSALRDQEEENGSMKSDLEALRRKLQESEHQRAELTSDAQQGLEEMSTLNNFRRLPARPTDRATSVFDTMQPRRDSPAPPTDRVTHYLLSLRNAAGIVPQHGDDPPKQPRDGDRRRLFSREPSSREALSNCSVTSGSTFNTEDETAFRDGLEALDASIASLQRTIQLDLNR